MNCPLCKEEMTEEDLGGVKVDACRDGCKGLWFDWKELIELDETDEGFGLALKEALNSPRNKDVNRGQINCPQCNIPMVAHLYQRANAVTVDECYACGGFFLDPGELKVIRENFMTNEERKAYTNEIIKMAPAYHKFKEDSEKSKRRTRAVEKFAAVLNTNVIEKLLFR